MAKQSSGTGKGGKSFQDRELAAKVRTKGLNDVLAVLEGKASVQKWSELKKQLVLRLAPGLLPKLNEHTGKDGEKLFPTPILDAVPGDNSA